MCERAQNVRLTTQRPCRAFHQSCMSPGAPLCVDVSACGRCSLPSSDLGKERDHFQFYPEITQYRRHTIFSIHT